MGKVSRPIWSAIDGDRWGNGFPVERVVTGDSKAENNNRAYLHMSIDKCVPLLCTPLTPHKSSIPLGLGRHVLWPVLYSTVQ